MQLILFAASSPIPPPLPKKAAYSTSLATKHVVYGQNLMAGCKSSATSIKKSARTAQVTTARTNKKRRSSIRSSRKPHAGPYHYRNQQRNLHLKNSINSSLRSP